MVSARPLHVFLPPVSAPQAAPEHMHLPRQAGVETEAGGAREPTGAGRAGGGIGGRVSKPAQAGTPPNAHGGRGWHKGKGAAMAAQLLVHHSTMAPGFYGGPGFFHKHSRLWSSLHLPLRLSLRSQQLSSPWVCSPNPMLQHPTPLCASRRDSGWAMHGCSMDHPCRSYSVLPATDLLLCSPPSFRSSLSVPADLPTC